MAQLLAHSGRQEASENVRENVFWFFFKAHQHSSGIAAEIHFRKCKTYVGNTLLHV